MQLLAWPILTGYALLLSAASPEVLLLARTSLVQIIVILQCQDRVRYSGECFHPPIWLGRLRRHVQLSGGIEGLSHLRGKVCQIMFAQEGLLPAVMHECLRQQFFSDPTQWWDKGSSKPIVLHPDFQHKEFKVVLWLNNWQKPIWVDSQLARWEAWKKRNPEPVSTSVKGDFAGHEGHSEARTCRKLCDHGRIEEAVDSLNLLVQRGRHVPSNLFYRLLKRCIAGRDLLLGRHIHALSAESGYEGDDFLATHIINMYASHGRLEEAMRVFTKVSTPSAYSWATIIFAYAKHGKGALAIRLYRQMRQSAVEPDNRIYSAVLKACASAGDIVAGKEVHAHILASPGKPDIFVQSGLLDMYAKCGRVEDARSVFDRLPDRNVVTWTAMIAGYTQQGMGQKALRLYSRMKQEGLSAPDSVTFICLLQACATVGSSALKQGKQLHADIEELGLQDDVVIGGSLVNMYIKCGRLEDARTVFDILPDRNIVTWNAMIAGYAQQGMGQEALSLYSWMQHESLFPPDLVTFVSLLQACASVGVGALHQGRHLHVQIQEQALQDDVVLGNSLINMYAKCGSLENARSVFDSLPDRNVVTWTSLITSYAQHGMGQEALSLYDSMQEEGLFSPDSVTFVSLLQSCASVGAGAVGHGKQLHAQIQERGLQDDVVLGCSLVSMYAKCGSLEDARNMFDRLPDKDVVTWNAMLAGYAQQGMLQEAFSLYTSMQQEGRSPPDSVTFVCLLQACATVAALPLGKQVHVQIEEQGLQADVVVGGALVNMYAKCGSMHDSQQVFDSLPERNIEAWGALISGYSRHGDSEVVFDLLDRMEVEGIQPTDIIFLSVLTVCSHVGLVDKGQKYFEVMESKYSITPTAEHYTCMMDLLGRAGHLEEALQMGRTMPFPSNAAVWHTLLGACRKWNNVEIGQQALEFAMGLDGKDAASYVLMSDIYARAQMWEEAKEMQARRKKCGAWKEPGQSWWTDMDGLVHMFVAGNKSHPESEDTYARLEKVVPKLRKEGYVPH